MEKKPTNIPFYDSNQLESIYYKQPELVKITKQNNIKKIIH